MRVSAWLRMAPQRVRVQPKPLAGSILSLGVFSLGLAGAARAGRNHRVAPRAGKATTGRRAHTPTPLAKRRTVDHGASLGTLQPTAAQPPRDLEHATLEQQRRISSRPTNKGVTTL